MLADVVHTSTHLKQKQKKWLVWTVCAFARVQLGYYYSPCKLLIDVKQRIMFSAYKEY
jgi:hypothetical protein